MQGGEDETVVDEPDAERFRGADFVGQFKLADDVFHNVEYRFVQECKDNIKSGAVLHRGFFFIYVGRLTVECGW